MKKGLVATLLASILVVGATPIPASAEWRQGLNNQWCWTDARNWKVTSWNQIDGSWYYFDSNGIMKTGWIEYTGQWYYANQSGIMQKGWIKEGNSWYYFGNTGVMSTDAVVDGYYLGEDGVMQDASKNKVLFEDEYAKVTYIGVNKESKLGPKIKIRIENKSDRTLSIQSKDDFTVDNTKKSASLSEDIIPKSTFIANIILSNGTDKNFKIVNGKIRITEKNSGNVLKLEEVSMNFQ